ncbi:hypothetical protein X992_5493 [Burkholderia pseudomallei MSHR5492]|nr:hypothetical protein X992_5493 [Burkholderia pseudomallei MSHR5492]
MDEMPFPRQTGREDALGSCYWEWDLRRARSKIHCPKRTMVTRFTGSDERGWRSTEWAEWRVWRDEKADRIIG